MTDSTRRKIRDATARYPADPQRTRAAIEAELAGKPAEPAVSELAEEMLSRYGFTAEDIRQGIAEGGTVEVLAFRDDEDGDRR